jgi:hypothetical protein
MNKILRISFFAFAIFLIIDSAAFAQRRPSKKTDEPTPTDGEKKEETTTRPTRAASKSTDKYFDESGGFKHRLWYGGGFNLGLSGSSFQVGITPMVGYKIVGDLSAGPRMGITYNSYSNGVTRESVTDYYAGAFARYKFLGFLFLHAEYGYSSKNYFDQYYNPIKLNRFSPALGGGYNSSNGLFGYEIALLYDPTIGNITSSISPLDIRFGFNYNF